MDTLVSYFTVPVTMTPKSCQLSRGLMSQHRPVSLLNNPRIIFKLLLMDDRTMQHRNEHIIWIS